MFLELVAATNFSNLFLCATSLVKWFLNLDLSFVRRYCFINLQVLYSCVANISLGSVYSPERTPFKSSLTPCLTENFPFSLFNPTLVEAKYKFIGESFFDSSFSLFSNSLVIASISLASSTCVVAELLEVKVCFSSPWL